MIEIPGAGWKTSEEMREAGRAVGGIRRVGVVFVFGLDARNSDPNRGWRASLRV